MFSFKQNSGNSGGQLMTCGFLNILTVIINLQRKKKVGNKDKISDSHKYDCFNYF